MRPRFLERSSRGLPVCTYAWLPSVAADRGCLQPSRSQQRQEEATIANATRGKRGNVRRASCSQDPPSEAHRPGDRLTRECEDTRARSVNAPGPCAALLAVGFRRRSPAALSRGRAESGAFTVRFSRVIPARIVSCASLISRRCWLPKLFFSFHFIISFSTLRHMLLSRGHIAVGMGGSLPASSLKEGSCLVCTTMRPSSHGRLRVSLSKVFLLRVKPLAGLHA